MWPSGIKYDDVLLFLKDAAPYMIKYGKSLTALYSKMSTKLSNVKKIFRKVHSRIQIFKEEASEFSLEHMD